MFNLTELELGSLLLFLSSMCSTDVNDKSKSRELNQSYTSNLKNANHLCEAASK